MDLNEEDERELDRILEGAEFDDTAFDETPSQQVDPSQVELMGVVGSPTEEAIGSLGMAPHEGSYGVLRSGEGSCQGLSASLSSRDANDGHVNI